MLNMGGPATLEEVQPFLTRLFTDKDIIPLPMQRLLACPLLTLQLVFSILLCLSTLYSSILIQSIVDLKISEMFLYEEWGHI